MPQPRALLLGPLVDVVHLPRRVVETHAAAAEAVHAAELLNEGRDLVRGGHGWWGGSGVFVQ